MYIYYQEKAFYRMEMAGDVSAIAHAKADHATVRVERADNNEIIWQEVAPPAKASP